MIRPDTNRTSFTNFFSWENHRANWNVTQRYVNIGGVAAGAYPSGVHMGNMSERTIT
jgi:hypothetical protein